MLRRWKLSNSRTEIINNALLEAWDASEDVPTLLNTVAKAVVNLLDLGDLTCTDFLDRIREVTEDAH